MKTGKKTTRRRTGRWENHEIATERLFRKNVNPDGYRLTENQVLAREFLAKIKKYTQRAYEK
jgi:hypothetical protein